MTTANQKREAFMVDCIARSLATLPFATLDPDRDSTVRDLQQIVRTPTRDGIANLKVTLLSEVNTHEMCDNWSKAECIETWLASALVFLDDRVRTTTLRDGLKAAVRE